MIDRLTVLRAERANAADVLGDLRARHGGPANGPGGCQDRMETLMRRMTDLDRAIAACEGLAKPVQ